MKVTSISRKISFNNTIMSKQLPIVTIVGRQNVGKSTLFNALIREKKAIVDSYPGLTRDILNYSVDYKTASFVLSDTPGLDINDLTGLSQAIFENAKSHLERQIIPRHTCKGDHDRKCSLRSPRSNHGRLHGTNDG